jgi:CRISPR-associated protein Csm1
MNQNRQKIFLGALLHDIGKFYQRSDKSFSNKQNDLSEFSKKMANDICPVNDRGRFGYQHVIWTNEFFEKVQKTIDKIPDYRKNIYIETDMDNVVNLACNHHKPQSILQAIISLADWWSAGLDRNKESTFEVEEKNLDWGKMRYKNIPLYSIFNKINKGNGKAGFPLMSLSIDNSHFPHEIKAVDDGISEKDYHKLWNSFITEFEKLPTDSFDGFTESLIYLLKKYTWCIPANTMDMDHVSLFDHLKTTAAFADCLYSYYEENKSDFKYDRQDHRIQIFENQYPVLLVGGDLSGIQKFIYNIASRKAASSLKGRSFYLQLLIDSVIQRIISHPDIQATMAHVVYSSGGKFYMLLPNIEKVKTALNKLEKEFEKELWDEHHGKLILNIDSVAFAYHTKANSIMISGRDKDTDLGTLWKTLADKLTSKKNQKFKKLLIDDFNGYFGIKESGGDVKVCAVTGDELTEGNIFKIPKSETTVSKSVKSHIELGNTLKDCDFNITFKGDDANSNYLSNRLKHKNSIFNVANYLFDQGELTINEADFRKISSADVSRVKRINNTDFLAINNLKGKSVSYGFQFYGGNKQAYNNFKKRDRTFEELTQSKLNDESSETYLGVLRMDVDGLGEIFINGIPESMRSFSSYATLSHHLDWFFSGYLNTIKEKYSKHVNILYSGGDDVFAVGRWVELLAFAEDVRNEFRKYVGKEDISISAGIVLTGNKFPIAKAAELAGKAEEEAKKYGLDKDKNIPAQKNAINFLGKSLSWDREFNIVKLKKNDFLKYIEKENLTRGILHRFMLFDSIRERNERLKGTLDSDENIYVPDLSYHWNAAYYLKRFMENKSETVQSFCKTLQPEMFKDRELELNALAARWAELELRSKK